MSSKRPEEEGTYMRGADGAVYFIPDKVMETCRIPDDVVDAINKEADEEDVEGHAQPRQLLEFQVMRGGARLTASGAYAPITATLRRSIFSIGSAVGSLGSTRRRK